MDIDYKNLVITHGGIRPAARASNIPLTTFRDNYLRQKATGDTKPKKVFYFTDTHDTPTQDKTHLYHIAKHIRDSKPDLIIHGGDLWDCVSLCHHVDNASYKGKFKPSLKADLDSLHEAVQILTEESGRRDFHMTSGNHENWLWQYENRNPEVFGFAQESFEAIFKSVGWTVYPYGRYVDFGGVNFIHAPLNLMGKARGGENAAKQATTRAVRDIVFGHTHRFSHHQEAKDGNDEWVIAINAGCTMPDGYRPDYATGQLGWYYGGVEFTIADNHIQHDVKQISLKELRERYG